MVLVLSSCEKKELPPEPNTEENPVVVQPETPPKPETPPNPETPSAVDMTLLPGNWRLTSKPQGYYGLYFGDDHFFKQDNSDVWAIDLNGFWRVSGKNTVELSGDALPTTFLIEKLNKDSLVGKINGVTFRHIRVPIVQSDYALSTLVSDLQTPVAVTEDQSGNIYFLEYFGERINKISVLDQKISVIVGLPKFLFEPVIGLIGRLNDFALDKNNDIVGAGDAGYLIRISLANKTVSDIPVDYSHSDGTIDATLRNSTRGILIDQVGNIYESEPFYAKIRKIEHGSGIIKNIIGSKRPNGDYQFDPNPGQGLNAYIIPNAMAWDRTGNLLLADGIANCIWRYNLATGNIQLIAGTGIAGFGGDGQNAAKAMFNSPSSIAVDAEGNIFIADSGNNRIRKISAFDNKISTIAGNGFRGHNGEWNNALMGKLTPTKLYVEPDGDIVFVDGQNNSIRKLTLKK